MLRLRGLARCRRPAGRAACGAPRALSALTKAETDKAKKPKQSLSSLALAGEVLRLAKPERPLLAAGTAGLLVAAGVSMYVPTALGTVIDLVTGQRVDTDVATYSLFLGGALAAGGAAAFVRVLAFQLAGQRLVARVRRRLFGALLEREVEFFDRNRTGELVSRLASDTAEMSRSLAGPQLSQGLRSAAQALAGFGYMFYLSPELTGVVTGVVPVAAGGAFLYGRFVKRLSGRVQDALAEATAVAEERLGNVRTVRAFVQEEAARRRYGEAVDRVYQLAKKEALAGATFFSSSTLVGYAGVLGVLLYGGSSGALTGGALTSFLLYTAMVGGSVLSLSSFYSELMKSFGAADRVVKLLRASPAAAARAAGEVPGAEPRGEVRFEGVSFRYPTRPDAPVLRGLDLEVPANSSLAVVGRSGGGKSTLAALLLRFYEPGEGAVLLDGRPVAELDAAWLRRHIGYVSQDPALFDASIRENIAYGRPDATDEEIERAARDASAHEFCAALPDGYDTRVGNASLSGGQRQRVAIARALLKDPRLLILDEATSALDSKSERLVQDALQRLRRGRTVIVIAHRLSTVVSADRIAVLDGGAVAELGTHAELSARPDSLYTELMRHGDLAPPAAATDEGEAGDEVPGLAPEGAVK